MAPGARLDPRLFANTKDEAFGPVKEMLAIASGVLPMFVKVTDCAALEVPTVCGAKVRLLADNETNCPMPLRVMVCGEEFTLSEIVRVAANGPGAAGLNCIWMAPLALGAKVDPQLLTNGNEEELGPLKTRLVMLRGALPVFVRVMN